MGERRRAGGGALHHRSGAAVALARRSHRRTEARVAGAGSCRDQGRRDRRPARSGAACRARARRSSRWPPRSRSRRRPATPCSARSTRRSNVGSDLWVCPVGRAGRARRESRCHDLRQHDAARRRAGVTLTRGRARRRARARWRPLCAGARSSAAPDAWWDGVCAAKSFQDVAIAMARRAGRRRVRRGDARRRWSATRSNFPVRDRRARRRASASSSCFTVRRSPSRTSARARSRG